MADRPPTPATMADPPPPHAIPPDPRRPDIAASESYAARALGGACFEPDTDRVWPKIETVQTVEDRGTDLVLRAHAGEVFLLALVAFGLDFALVVGALLAWFGVWPALAGHAFLSLLLVLWARRRDGENGEDGPVPLAWLLVLSTAFLGPLGALGTIVAAALFTLYRPNARPFEDWYESLFPDADVDPTNALIEELNLTGHDPESGLAPFRDVMSFGSVAQKQVAIALMSKNFDARFSPALLLALGDENSAVRVQAATALTKIENDFVSRSLELELRARHKRGRARNWRLLASHFDAYAHTGLLDREREDEYRAKALGAFMKFLELRPDNKTARLAVGRLLLRSGRAHEAAGWLQDCIDGGIDMSEVVMWLMEALHANGRFGRVRELARDHQADLTRLDKYPANAVDMIKLWSTDGRPEGLQTRASAEQPA